MNASGEKPSKRQNKKKTTISLSYASLCREVTKKKFYSSPHILGFFLLFI